MCYPAQIWAEYRKYERFFWERRHDGTWRKIPKRMKDSFSSPRNDAEREIRAIIVQGDAELERTLQADLFKQKKRLADAERAGDQDHEEGSERAAN